MDLHKSSEILRKIPMFTKLEPSKLKLLAFTSELLTFENAEILFHEGDPADCAYVIMSGEIEILARTDAGDVVVGTLSEHQLFGELAVLTNEPRSATLRAKGELRALRITDEAFLKLVSENPEVALDVMRQLSEKLALTHKKVTALESEVLRRGKPS
ncbi:MAG: cyclic nucleotide-binding domain-containing protein [Acidiferrobacterales bacterium]